MYYLSGTQAHFLLELLAYFIGARIYWAATRNQPKPAQLADRMALLAGAIFGAALGSKGLHVLEHLTSLRQSHDPALWLAGKSVLGGFIGGTLGVELAKQCIGWKRSTGDAWVPALTAGLVIGRLGCQLSGLWDQTYGTATDMPWAWDYGDGIGRHPTALYEILGVAALFMVVRTRWRNQPGARFAVFMGSYCGLRFLLEFFKPPFGPTAAGSLPVDVYGVLTAIQWAALFGLMVYGWLYALRIRPHGTTILPKADVSGQ